MSRKKSSAFDFGEDLFDNIDNFDKVDKNEDVVKVADNVGNIDEVVNIAKDDNVVSNVDNVVNVATDIDKIDDVVKVEKVANINVKITEAHKQFINLYSRKEQKSIKEIFTEWINDTEKCDKPAEVIKQGEKKTCNFRVEVTQDVRDRFETLVQESWLSKTDFVWWLIEKHKSCETFI